MFVRERDFSIKSPLWKRLLSFFSQGSWVRSFLAGIFQQASCRSEGMHLEKANDSFPPYLVPLYHCGSASHSASISSSTAPPISPSLSPLIYIKSILLPRPCYLSISASSLVLPPWLCVISVLCWFAVGLHCEILTCGVLQSLTAYHKPTGWGLSGNGGMSSLESV